MSKNQAIVNAYGDFIGKMEWSFYCTLSTAYTLSLKSAKRNIEKMHVFLSENLEYQNNIFWVAEPFDSKYSYHIHCLVKLNTESLNKSKRDINNAWQIVTGGGYGKKYNWTKIYPYKAYLKGNYYVTKYICKADVDYGFL
jgi:hypothetical protein